MTQKFKVGDRVRRVKHSYSTLEVCPIGYETTVEELLNYDLGFWYTAKNGERLNTSSPGDWELASHSPVREVTRKEIVPGTYGTLVVHETRDKSTAYVGWRTNYQSSAELRAAAAALVELADALEAA